MKRLLLVVMIVVVLGAALWLWGRSPTQPPQMLLHDLPWLITVLPGGGSRVFGVELGVTPMKALSDRTGIIPEVGVFVRPDSPPVLEAYFGRVRLGPFEARVITTLAADEQTLARFVAERVSEKPMPSGSRRLELTEANMRVAYGLPIAALTYVPYAQYEPGIVERRFGLPVERLALSETAGYWLYPDLGLALMLDTKGRDVLEYVAPRDFAALRARLDARQARESLSD